MREAQETIASLQVTTIAGAIRRVHRPQSAEQTNLKEKEAQQKSAAANAKGDALQRHVNERCALGSLGITLSRATGSGQELFKA